MMNLIEEERVPPDQVIDLVQKCLEIKRSSGMWVWLVKDLLEMDLIENIHREVPPSQSVLGQKWKHCDFVV